MKINPGALKCFNIRPFLFLTVLSTEVEMPILAQRYIFEYMYFMSVSIDEITAGN